jgi:hypothetical protein
MAGARRGLARLVIAGVLLASRGPTNALHVGDRISRLETAESAWEEATPAETPPMGWNSWYALGGESGWARTNEATIRDTADALRETGLAAAGYRCACELRVCSAKNFRHDTSAHAARMCPTVHGHMRTCPRTSPAGDRACSFAWPKCAVLVA